MPDCSGAEDNTQNLANNEDMGYKENEKNIQTYYQRPSGFRKGIRDKV
jgi:hypothetical protein